MSAYDAFGQRRVYVSGAGLQNNTVPLYMAKGKRRPVMSDEQKAMIRQCLLAIAEGPFLDEYDFHTRIGLDRNEAIKLIAANEMPDNESAFLLINNSLNEVENGISFSVREWNKWFTVTREKVRAVYSFWYSRAEVSGGVM